jgi:DegV family protein with EDD domain
MSILPSAGKFAELYEKLKEEYECGIAIHVSAKLSGTLASSVSGAEMADFKLYAVDSMSVSYGQTGLLERGLELAGQGIAAEEIAQRLKAETSNFRNYILIGNLSQLYKGGRMSGAQYYLGSLLQIKPIVQISNEGELAPIDKVRSHKKAVQYLLAHAKKEHEDYGIKAIQVIHGNVRAEAENLKQEVEKIMPEAKVTIGNISSSIAVHAGEGSLALMWRKPVQ